MFRRPFPSLKAKRSGGKEMAVLDASSWLPANLPWVESFWRNLAPGTLLRLNPHWMITPKKGSELFDVEDIYLEQSFRVKQADTYLRPGEWKAEIEPLGLTLMAREQDGAVQLRYIFDPHDAADPPDLRKLQEMVSFWLISLREYYRLYATKKLTNPFWRFFMNRVMLTMNPLQRRICSAIFKVTVLEIVLIVALLVGFHFLGSQ